MKTLTRSDDPRISTHYYDFESLLGHIRWFRNTPQTYKVLDRRLWRLINGAWVEYNVFIHETEEPLLVGGPK